MVLQFNQFCLHVYQHFSGGVKFECHVCQGNSTLELVTLRVKKFSSVLRLNFFPTVETVTDEKDEFYKLHKHQQRKKNHVMRPRSEAL